MTSSLLDTACHPATVAILEDNRENKARFPLPELTGDRFPLPVNTGRVDGRAFPLAHAPYLWKLETSNLVYG